ncbi:MAG TPA: LysR family transcriptional regulator [Burkholderiaceae bacterium]|nr:LysR family transcriptional regulator [Burkholderiaceae bacterium]
MKERRVDELWSHVHWLCVLSSMGSFTAAANRLGVSKAAVSQRIRELEQAVGMTLVRRTTRSTRLTEAGQRLVETTEPSFVEIERNVAGVKDLAGTPRGLIRVTVGMALGRQQIAPLVPAFLRENPEARIEMEFSDRLSSLAREGFDLAIRHVSSVPDTHVAWTLCETRALLVASRTYLRRRGPPGAPADLARHDCLHYLRAGESPTWTFEPARGKGARTSVAVRGILAANNSEALREAALRHLGIALLPDFSASRDLDAGRLVPVLPDWRSVGSFGERIYAIRPYSQYVPRIVQAFVLYLRSTLKKGFARGTGTP